MRENFFEPYAAKITASPRLIHDVCTINKNEISIKTAQKMKFPIKDFFSKCDQIRSFLRIWLHLLKKF